MTNWLCGWPWFFKFKPKEAKMKKKKLKKRIVDLEARTHSLGLKCLALHDELGHLPAWDMGAVQAKVAGLESVARRHNTEIKVLQDYVRTQQALQADIAAAVAEGAALVGDDAVLPTCGNDCPVSDDGGPTADDMGTMGGGHVLGCLCDYCVPPVASD